MPGGGGGGGGEFRIDRYITMCNYSEVNWRSAELRIGTQETVEWRDCLREAICDADARNKMGTPQDSKELKNRPGPRSFCGYLSDWSRDTQRMGQQNSSVRFKTIWNWVNLSFQNVQNLGLLRKIDLLINNTRILFWSVAEELCLSGLAQQEHIFMNSQRGFGEIMSHSLNSVSPGSVALENSKKYPVAPDWTAD